MFFQNVPDHAASKGHLHRQVVGLLAIPLFQKVHLEVEDKAAVPIVIEEPIALLKVRL